MKIAFDLRRIANPGIGRYMKCLTEAIMATAPQHEYLLVLPAGAENAVACASLQVERITTDLKYYSWREQIVLPGVLRRHKVDLLHVPHFNMPLRRVCPTVVTIHDVIYLSCPEDLPSRVGRLYYRWMMAASVRLSRRIVTVSDFSKKDVVRRLGADAEKIEVIHSGVDSAFQQVTDQSRLAEVRAKYGIAGDYLIYTGIYKPRKNHTGLLKAFRWFLEHGPRAQLVIAGPMGDGEVLLRKLAAELGIANEVVFTGYVNESDLPALYSGARVYVCPSLYEGFGFTVLEAMACGVPVVCSKETSLPEVAGDAALFADARVPAEFGAAMHRVFFDYGLSAALTENGRKNLQRFSWPTAARKVLDMYEHVLRRDTGGIPD